MNYPSGTTYAKATVLSAFRSADDQRLKLWAVFCIPEAEEWFVAYGPWDETPPGMRGNFATLTVRATRKKGPLDVSRMIQQKIAKGYSHFDRGSRCHYINWRSGELINYRLAPEWVRRKLTALEKAKAQNHSPSQQVPSRTPLSSSEPPCPASMIEAPLDWF